MRDPNRSPVLAVSNGEHPGPGVDVCREDNRTHADDETSATGSTVDHHSDNSQAHSPLIMGNNNSASAESLESQDRKPSNSSRLGRFRSALRNSTNKKSKDDKKQKRSEDAANNNKVDTGSPNGLHYTDNITRSTTLPSYIHKASINGSPLNGSIVQTRILPAYKGEQACIIGNIQNRQRIMSSPSYSPRNRVNSQSSAYSPRYNTFNRVSATHIPAHLDKRLVRSRSVGVIPAAELRMRRAASASVVKLADCEDWVV